jgi:hypothetical protein
MLPPAAIDAESRAAAENPGWAVGSYAALAVAMVGLAAGIGISGWYTRRRLQ